MLGQRNSAGSQNCTAIAVLRDARAHVDIFFELYWRVFGELAVIVEQVEGMPPISMLR
jgi:hypothetical protein